MLGLSARGAGMETLLADRRHPTYQILVERGANGKRPGRESDGLAQSPAALQV